MPHHSKVVFESTGREDSANRHIIGIDPELNTFGGYDGNFPEHNDEREPKKEEFWELPELTPEERRELAVYMLKLWGRYYNTQLLTADPDDFVQFSCPVCGATRGRPVL